MLQFGTWMTELCIIKPNRRNRMKLAEALSIRADLQNRIDQLKSRLKYSAKVQEGDQPSEDVNELYKELDECLSQFEEIVYRINRTNMQTVHEGETLTQMIARKDALKCFCSRPCCNHSGTGRSAFHSGYFRSPRTYQSFVCAGERGITSCWAYRSYN